MILDETVAQVFKVKDLSKRLKNGFCLHVTVISWNLLYKVCCLMLYYVSVTQLHHIPLDAGLSSIVWCSLSDPYAVMMTADGSIILLEFTLEGTEPKVKISRPQINQVSFLFCGFVACFGQHKNNKAEYKLTKIHG